MRFILSSSYVVSPPPFCCFFVVELERRLWVMERLQRNV